MLSTNEAITNTCWRIAAGNPLLNQLEHGWCLMGARMIVEYALHWKDMEFYRRFGRARTTQGAEARSDWSWWAADIEKSMKELGFAVNGDAKKPGDLVFNYRAAKPYGHVGIYAGRNLILEVVDPVYRPNSFSRRSICFTPFPDWEPTLVARLPQDS